MPAHPAPGRLRAPALLAQATLVVLVAVLVVLVALAPALADQERDHPPYRVAPVTTLTDRPTWFVPVSDYRLTARFGATGFWSSAHTGLDFAAPSGTPIVAVTGGLVTQAGYDGAYGYKTVVQADDGTEFWYCHQSAILVSVGQTVDPGEVIGAVGSTGNSTGSHLHLEVRADPDTPLDPYAELVRRGLTL